MDISEQIKQALENHGEAKYFQKEEDQNIPLYEKILLESGDYYDRGIAIITGLQDHLRSDYMKTDGRQYLLECCFHGQIAIEETIDILEYERNSNMEYDLDFMKHLVAANNRFRARMKEHSEEPGEAFISEYAAYLESREMFVERTEFLKRYGRYNPLNEGNNMERVISGKGKYLTEGPINVPKDTLQIIPWGHFTKQWLSLGLKSSHFKKYKRDLRKNPAKGFTPPKGSEGLSVSDCWVSEITIPQGNVIRVVYTYIKSVNRIFCLMVYSHIPINGIRGQKDLTKDDKKWLNIRIKRLKEKYSKGGK